MNTLAITALQAPGPIFKEVKRGIVTALMRGEWAPGGALPPEPKLAERYGISIGTVRRAIDELVAENVLVRQQGRGTFVASHGRDRMRFLFFNIVRHDGVKDYPIVRLERFRKLRADEETSTRLRIAPRSPVFRFLNSLWLEGRAVMIDDIGVPAALFEGMSEALLRTRDNTIYQLYQERFGVSVVRTGETVRAIAAPEEVASLLDVPPGAPLLEIRRVAYALHDRPVEFRRSWVDSTRHEYRRDAGI